MNYIEIDFNKVNGYLDLSEKAKELFEKVYKTHNAGQGMDYKDQWKPIKVKEHKSHLEVHFKNGEWFHYLPNCT